MLDGHRSIPSIALGVQAARRGFRVAFATAHEWVGRLGAAKRAGKLESELERLGRIQLVIVDEVGYIPFDPEAGALFFALISSRYERRRSGTGSWSSWPRRSPGSCLAMADVDDRAAILAYHEATKHSPVSVRLRALNRPSSR